MSPHYQIQTSGGITTPPSFSPVSARKCAPVPCEPGTLDASLFLPYQTICSFVRLSAFAVFNPSLSTGSIQ